MGNWWGGGCSLPTSADDFRVIHDDLTSGHRVTTGRLVPFCMFTHPELAQVGLNETHARAEAVAYRPFKAPAEAVLRAHPLFETPWFLKALVATDSDSVLGFTTFGVDAGEVMTSVQVAMASGLPYTTLRDAILVQPMMMKGLSVASEVINTGNRHPKQGRRQFRAASGDD